MTRARSYKLHKIGLFLGSHSVLVVICAMVLAMVMMLLTIALGVRRFSDKSPPVVGKRQRCNLSNVPPRSIPREDCLYGFEVGLHILMARRVLGHCSFAVAKDEDSMGVPMEEVHEGMRYK